MNIRNQIQGLLLMGDREQEEAWGVPLIVSGVSVMGVLSPAEMSYDVEIGGNRMRVNSSARVKKSYLDKIPLAGQRVTVDDQHYRIARVRDWRGDVAWDLDLAEL
ncbi:MAG: hypothetical protein RR506_07965 [Akkermansia sp.]